MNSPNPQKYAGADWLQATLDYKGVTLSRLGRRVADLIGQWQLGIYHVSQDVCRKPKAWADPYHIDVVIGSSGLTTFDGNSLTRLVFLAHDHAIRVSLNPCNPRYLRLRFHARKREGALIERHPTVEQALSAHRAHFGDSLNVEARP